MYFIQSPFLLNHYTTSDYHFQSGDTYKCSVNITKTVCQKNELTGIFRSERQLSLDNHLRSDIIRIDSLYVFMEVFMLINSDTIFSMTQANQNFSQVARTVDKSGEAVIFKNNKPKYLVVDIDDNERMLDLTDDEKIEIVAKRILKKYIGAFKELAK
jgi:antitoxin Phd